MLQNSVQARSAFYVCTKNHQHRNTQEQKELSTFYNSGSGFLFVFFTSPIARLSGCSRGQDPVFRVLEHASCSHDYLFFRAK